ncbi:MAG: response regulator [Clostridiales bacterium]|nr:response regulator [Clostridiales bacterium]
MFRILVVEDDMNTRKLMCAVLKQGGFEPLAAEDGHVALDLIESEHIDLAIVDLMMSGMDRAIVAADSFEGFLSALRGLGYEIRGGVQTVIDGLTDNRKYLSSAK